MGRSQRSQARVVGPEPAQLRAIERLFEDERYAEALERSARLQEKFPHHTGVRSAHLRALMMNDFPHLALKRADAWMREHPNSATAARLTAVAGLAAGLPHLALEGVERLRALDEDADLEQDVVEAAQDMRDTYRVGDPAAAARLETGLLHSMCDEHAAADAILGTFDVPIARRALGHTRFAAGDLTGALDAVWPLVEAGDDHADGMWTAHLCALILEDGQRLEALAGRWRALKPSDVYALADQLLALLLLEQPEAAAAALAAAPAALLEPEEAAEDDEGSDVTGLIRALNAAAAVCARDGDTERAVDLLEQAADLDPDDVCTRDNLDGLVREEEPVFPTVLQLRDWLPGPSLRRAVDALQESLEHLSDDDDSEVEIVQDDFDLAEPSAYLGLMARQGEALARKVARTALARRAERAGGGAAEALRRLLVEPGLYDEERLDAARALYFAHQLPRRGRLDIVLEGEPRSLHVEVPLVLDRSPDLGLDADQRARFGAALVLRYEGKQREAAEVLGALITAKLPRAAELEIDHELALIELDLPARRESGRRRLATLLQAPDCMLRTRLYDVLQRLYADGEAAAEAAEALLASLDWKQPWVYEDVLLALRLREEAAWFRSDDDDRLASLLARKAAGAFAVGDDGQLLGAQSAARSRAPD